MEMKDILDIDLDMENQSLTEYMENLRIDNFEHYEPDHSGEMVLDARRHPNHLDSDSANKEQISMNLGISLCSNIVLPKNAVKPR